MTDLTPMKTSTKDQAKSIIQVGQQFLIILYMIYTVYESKRLIKCNFTYLVVGKKLPNGEYTLKQHCWESYDYILVNIHAWDYFKRWYGYDFEIILHGDKDKGNR